jgi:hypothetical protein
MRILIPISLITLAACGSTPPATSPVHTGGDEPPVAATADAGVIAVAPAPDAEPAPDPAQIKADLLAGEQQAYESARPVFERYCADCHADGGKGAKPKTLEHFDMTRYPFGGHHVATLGPTIQHVLGIDGSKPSMPRNKKGAVQGDDLALVKAWTEAWQAADDGGAHED